MWKHVERKHDGKVDNVKFDVKVTGKFTKLLARQINEAYRISQKTPIENHNSKREFNSQQIKKIVIEGEDNGQCKKCIYDKETKTN